MLLRTLTAALALALTAAVAAPAAADSSPPETVLVTKSWSHTAHIATFTLSSPEPSVTYECQLDRPSGAGAWGSCPPVGSSSAQYASLVEGFYTFRARARDAAGNVDPTPVEVRFNIGIDTVKPTTTLLATTATTSRTASFTFTASEAATFECRLQRSGQPVPEWTGCESPVEFTSLVDGSYTFEVKATDLNGEFEAISRKHTWLLDATAPETSLSPYPQGRSASFGFNSTGGTFQCHLDGPSQAHDWKPCSSPARYADLTDGDYVFSVRALDHHGNIDPTPAMATWYVGAPETAVSSGPKPGSWLVSDTARFAWSATPGTTFRCTLDGGARSCGSSGVTLSGLGAGHHRFTVAASSYGLTDPTPVVREFTVPRSAWATKFDKSWARKTSRSSFLGHHLTTRSRGATLTTRFTRARSIALVATTAPRAGVVKVYVGRRLVKTAKLNASRRTAGRIVPVTTFDRATSGKLRVVVTSKGRTVVLEGIAIR